MIYRCREACLRILIQVLVLILSNVEIYMEKKCKMLLVFWHIMKTRTLIKNLRQASLDKNLKSSHRNFQVQAINSKRDIHVQKNQSGTINKKIIISIIASLLNQRIHTQI